MFAARRNFELFIYHTQLALEKNADIIEDKKKIKEAINEAFIWLEDEKSRENEDYDRKKKGRL